MEFFRVTVAIYIYVTIAIAFLFRECRTQYLDSHHSCENVKVQLGVNVQKMISRWNVVEILYHIRNTEQNYSDRCIKVDIKMLSDDKLHLNWEEDVYTVGYKFDINNKSVWESVGPQTQSPNIQGYQQFAGKVLVVKAAHDNAVITFCSSNQFYSLVLVKSIPVNKTELESIRKMFERYDFKIYNKHEYCKNGSSNFNSLLLIPILIIVSVIYNSSSQNFIP